MFLQDAKQDPKYAPGIVKNSKIRQSKEVLSGQSLTFVSLFKIGIKFSKKIRYCE